MTKFKELIAEHQELQKQLAEQPDSVDVERVVRLVERVRAAGASISDPRQRQQLRAIPTHWGPYIFSAMGEYPETQLAAYGETLSPRQRSPLMAGIAELWDRVDPRAKMALVILCGLGFIAICVGVALATGASLMTMLGPTPSATSPATAAPAVSEATPTPTSAGTLAPAETPAAPMPTPKPTPLTEPTPTATPMPEPSPTPPSPDAQGDVGTYASGEAVEGVPAGMDISAASAGDDLRVVLQPTEGVPADLVGWAADGEILLWVSSYEPVPDPPTVYTEWVFALDLDGDIGTGRPAGSARINPDLGMEVAIVAYYDPAEGEYVPYYLVWNPGQGDWANGPGEVRFTLSEDRTLAGLAMSLDTLTQTATQITGVAVVPEAVKGRAAVVSLAAGQRVIDFYPDRPD